MVEVQHAVGAATAVCTTLLYSSIGRLFSRCHTAAAATTRGSRYSRQSSQYRRLPLGCFHHPSGMNPLRNTQIPQFPKSSPTLSFHSCLETKEVGSTGLIWSRSAYILHWISFVQTLELRVPLCCEKCINKVKKALYQVEGVEDVVCDQAEQKVTITGNVNPEIALRRVKRVKKNSIYWYIETSVDSATPATSIVHNKTHRNGYAPNYIAPSSYYTHNYYAHPLRRSDSSLQSPYYSRYLSAYPLRSYSPFQSSPYIDNSYDAYDPYNPMYSSRPYYMSNPYF